MELAIVLGVLFGLLVGVDTNLITNNVDLGIGLGGCSMILFFDCFAYFVLEQTFGIYITHNTSPHKIE